MENHQTCKLHLYVGTATHLLTHAASAYRPGNVASGRVETVHLAGILHLFFHTIYDINSKILDLVDNGGEKLENDASY